MNQKVSVILPVYNRSRTLENSIRSVLNQSYRDLELIVVDDASTEDLRPIIDKIEDERLRYVRLPVNGGASVARNEGLKLAEGDFIAFQDSDDLWLPWKLEKQVELLAAQPPEIGAVTGSKILYGRGPDDVYGSGRVSLRPPPSSLIRTDEDQIRRSLVENRISLQNALFRRDCYPNLNWFDNQTRSNADWAFTSSLVQHTRILETIDPVVVAFSSPDGISKNQKQKAIGLIRIMKRNRSVFQKYPMEYSMNLWRIGRILMRIGKRRSGMKFCLESLSRKPAVIFRVLSKKY